MTARRPFYVALLVAALGSLGFVSINGSPYFDVLTVGNANSTATILTLGGATFTWTNGTSTLTQTSGNLYTGGELRGLQATSTQASGSDGFRALTSGARWHIGGGASDYLSSDGTTITFAGPVKSAATQTRGTITLSAGTGTATVISGAVCVCTDTTANASVKCAVATTTLTATGTASDVIAYVCY